MSESSDPAKSPAWRRTPEQVRELFSRIAPRYDFLNRLLSFRRDVAWRRRTAAQIPRDATVVLDLFAGTADLALTVAAERPGVVVIGCDFSLEMLRRAREKVRRAHRQGQVVLACADCAKLPFPDGKAEAVTAAFGMRYLSDPGAGLREMWRVLEPGGTAALLDFCAPRGSAWKGLNRLVWSCLVPCVGDALSAAKGAYSYFSRTVEGFWSQDEMCAAMAAAGFADVGYRDLDTGICTLFWGHRPRTGGAA